MMTINLLPWREQLRSRRKREFFSALLVMTIIGFGILLLAGRYHNVSMRAQQRVNEQLRRELLAADASMAELSRLQQRQQDIQERLSVLDQLQLTQSEQLALLEVVASAVPAEVQLTRLRRQDGYIQVEGVAGFSTALPELMRRIDATGKFHASLQEISSIHTADGASPYSAFSLTLDPVSPEPHME